MSTHLDDYKDPPEMIQGEHIAIPVTSTCQTAIMLWDMIDRYFDEYGNGGYNLISDVIGDERSGNSGIMMDVARFAVIIEKQFPDIGESFEWYDLMETLSSMLVTYVMENRDWPPVELLISTVKREIAK